MNYHNELIKIIDNLDHVPKLLLHSCCGPCSTYPVKILKEEGFAFNYDIGHDHTSNDTFKLEILDNDINIKEFHIHDSTKSKCHLEIGTGELDLKFYKDLSMQSYVVLEVKNSNDLINSVEKFKNI